MSNKHWPDLGQLTTRFSRDAIHMAIIPVTTGDVTLMPGQHVRLDSTGKAVPASQGFDGIGVVSPWLRGPVCPGNRFWLLLNPGTITGLRHDWSHPAFPNRTAADTAEREESEAWLREHIGPCEHYGHDFESVIEDIINGRGGTVFGREEREVPEEFYYHLERYTGVSVPRDQYFNCRC